MTSKIIFVSLVLLTVVGLVSFWVSPAYEKGVSVILIAVSNCLSAALGAKFGLAMPRPHDEDKEEESK